MIRKYRIGTPIETDSVVEKIKLSSGMVPGWEFDEKKKTLSMRMDADAAVYGLGVQVRGINKRGWHYVSFCADEPHHEEGKTSLYGANNFFVYVPSDKGDQRRFGMYVDTPGRVEFDIGFYNKDMFQVIFDEADAYTYLIEEEDDPDNNGASGILSIVRQFRRIIGRSYIAPRWAFGFGQSRWSYMNEDEVREVADAYDRTGIPLDSIYLDIDYMERYKDFTVSEENFPDFPAFVSEMKNRGLHLVPIIDAGVKIEKGYDVYEEGIAGDHFVKDGKGGPFTAAVWPGRVHFPDFLKEDTRRWFGEKYRRLTDAGIDGFWNDMNEPAIFYSEEHLAEVFEKLDTYKDKNLDIHSFFELQGLIGGLCNREEDYRSFYHEYKGERLRHDRVHNLYGFNMTRAAGEAFERIAPDSKPLLFSRASYIGMHRYAGIWTGDNMSWWSHLLLSIQQLPGLNMCGFLFAGSDIGGFGGDVTEELMIRWVSFGIFTPLFRNHSAMGTRRQELFRFNDTETMRRLVELRYALIPYLYSEYVRAAEQDEMLFRPLSFEYENDPRAAGVEDELFVGRSIMIAPVYTQNARGRYVYLPEEMKLVRFRSFSDYDEEWLSAGDHFLKAEPGEVLVFIRKGCELRLAEPVMRTSELPEYDELDKYVFRG